MTLHFRACENKHAMNVGVSYRHIMCEGPDLNRGTPARTDLESVAFDRAWLPSHECLLRFGGLIKIPRFENSTSDLDFISLGPLPVENIEKELHWPTSERNGETERH